MTADPKRRRPWFRTWPIVLVGMLAQAGVGVALLAGAESQGMGGAGLILGGLVLILFASLGLAPLLLLVFRRTRNIGAVVAILLGVAGMVDEIGMVMGPFLIVAGALALWKKV